MAGKNRIRQARFAAGYTQAKAAERYGCKQPSWSKLESRDVERLPIQRLKRIAKALRCKLSDLI